MIWIILYIFIMAYSLTDLASHVDMSKIKNHEKHCRLAPDWSEHAEICDFDYSELGMETRK